MAQAVPVKLALRLVQSHHGHDKTGRAEATLRTMTINHRLLHTVKRARARMLRSARRIQPAPSGRTCREALRW